MGFWSGLSKVLGEKPVDDSIYLYTKLSRPFHWLGVEDTGSRPCFKVKGITLAEASKAFMGKTIDWEHVDFQIQKALELGNDPVEVDLNQIMGMIK